MKNALILGYGKSGKSAYELLDENYNVYIFDDKIKCDNRRYINEEYILKHLPLFEIVIISPGFPNSHKILNIVRVLAREIISEVEFAFRFLKNKKVKIIAITGSVGKTSCASLIYQLLFKNYQTYLLGNIGTPFTSNVKNIKDNSVVILELSSFQLENIKDLRFDLGIITNVYPNHLDSVESFQYYIASKKKMFQNVKNEIVLVSDETYFKDYDKNIINYKTNDLFKIKYHQIYFKNKVIIHKSNLNYMSGYILYDIVIALLATTLLFGYKESYIDEIKKFKGIKYRQEIKKVNDTIFINDAKSTCVESLKNALTLYKKRIRIIILGGIYKSRGLDKITFKNSDEVYIYGRDKEIIKKEIKIGILKDQLIDVLNEIKKQDLKGRVLIFSPACSSYDQFENYIKRGEEFDKFIKEYENEQKK